MADGFIWYELITNDVDKAIAFYKTAVGWDIRDSGIEGMHYSIFGKDGKDVGGMMSWKHMGTSAPAVWIGHIHTANLDKELDALLADGGTIERPATVIPDNIGRFAVVRDPQNVQYMLYEPGRHDAAPRLGQHDAGNVGWHELLTTNSVAAWEFYAKHYGWQKDYAHDMGPMGVYQTFRMDKPKYSGAMMTIPTPENMPAEAKSSCADVKPSWRFYFTVDNVDEAAKRIVAAGGTVTMPPMDVPGGSRVVQGMDTEGGLFALTQNPKA